MYLSEWELIFIIQYYIYLVLVTSRGASLAPSHAASRTASPVFSAGAVSNSEDTSLPVVLCNLLQKEFSPRRSSFDDRSSRKGGGKGRRAGEEQEEEPGKQNNQKMSTTQPSNWRKTCLDTKLHNCPFLGMGFEFLPEIHHSSQPSFSTPQLDFISLGSMSWLSEKV